MKFLERKNNMDYTIFVDGAATMKKNENVYTRCAGGHAFVVYQNGIKIEEHSDGMFSSTNNEQELLAIYDALCWLKNNKDFDSFSAATICSDSAYCVNIFNSWIKSWIANNWTRGKKHEAIENLGIIKDIHELLNDMPNVKIIKVKGHDNCAGNIRADQLAVEAKKKFEIS